MLNPLDRASLERAKNDYLVFLSNGADGYVLIYIHVLDFCCQDFKYTLFA